MAQDENLGLFTLTKPVVSAHPTLITPKQFEKDGKPQGEAKYGLRLLFDLESDDLFELAKVSVRVARAKWPGLDVKAAIAKAKEGDRAGFIAELINMGRDFHFPFASGDALANKRKAKSGKDDGDFQRGMIVVAGRSKYRPKLGILEKGRLTDLADDAAIMAAKEKFYFGVKVLAQLNLVGYEGGTGPDGVTAYLQSVLSTNTGPKLSSGGASVAETFKAYVGSVSAEDPTGGGVLDDDIAF